jgi:hypothetical protein
LSQNNFEAGDSDVFQIRAPDCGELKKIRLYHDNKGLGAAWHCEIVIVRAIHTRAHSTHTHPVSTRFQPGWAGSAAGGCVLPG